MKMIRSVRESIVAPYFGSDLPRFVRGYYEQLKVDYAAAGISDAPPLGATPTWHDLYALEIALLKARTDDELRRSAWVVRSRFRNVAGEAGYQAYLGSLPPDPATAARATLLADLLTLVRRTYYLIVLSPASEAIRQRLLLYAILLGLFVLIVVLLVASGPNGKFDIFDLTLLAGAVGGTMSLIQRVQALPEADPILFRLSGGTTVLQSVLIPPLTGAIFAAFLFMLFAGHAVNGPIFPAFHAATGTMNFKTFYDGAVPDSTTSYALMLAWAFIAGYAERFVPDTINRLTAQRADDAKAR